MSGIVNFGGSFGPVSNRASWAESIATMREGEAVPEISEIVLSFGGDGCATQTHKLSAADKITYVDGIISWLIPVDTMRSVYPGIYPMGIVLTMSGQDLPYFLGSVEIVDGVVP